MRRRMRSPEIIHSIEIRQRQSAAAERTNTLKRQRAKRAKRVLLLVLEESMGNVRAACHLAGVDRSTFYNYKRNDSEFAQAVADIKEMQQDFAEHMLLQKIRDGSIQALKFYLQTFAQDRGYGKSAKQQPQKNEVDKLREEYSNEDAISILEEYRKRERG